MSRFHSILVLYLVALCWPVFISQAAPVSSFISRSGSTLVDSSTGTPFRFAGCNIYWLGLDENPMVAYPTHFRIEDAIHTAAALGLSVIRAHTVGVSSGNPQFSYWAKGVYNEKALDAADYAIYVAEQTGMRLIVPLTDNYAYYHGGYHDFTDFLGLSPNQFWNNSQAINLFLDYVTHRLNHVNPYTGRAARDEPSILAWESGNELQDLPAEWTATLANHIKVTLGAKQLFMDGRYGIDPASLPNKLIDIYSDHFYPMDVNKLNAGGQLTTQAGKVYYAGEYGWTGSNPDAVTFLQAAQSLAQSSQLSGTVFWSLMPHNDQNGFTTHTDGFSLYYPGAPTDPVARGFAYTIQAHAAFMNGQPTPKAAPVPTTAPLITVVNFLLNQQFQVSWRGAATAGPYELQVSTSSNTGPWTTICNLCATDFDTPITVTVPGLAFDGSDSSSSSWSSSTYWNVTVSNGQSVFLRVRGWSADKAAAGPWSPVWSN